MGEVVDIMRNDKDNKDPLHIYTNEAETDNWDIYDDLKLEKPFGLHGLYKYISALWVLKG